MDPQTIAVVVAVAAAAAFIAFRAVRRLRGKGDCGCEHCPKQDPPR